MDVLLHYFLKVRRRQRMKGLLGFCLSSGKPLMGLKRENSMIWFIFCKDQSSGSCRDHGL